MVVLPPNGCHLHCSALRVTYEWLYLFPEAPAYIQGGLAFPSINTQG